MSECEWNTGNLWQPCPELRLSRLKHTAICKNSPAFHELPAEEQQLVAALEDQFERWSHKPYFRHGLSGRIIAALNGYNFTAKLADCMMKSNPYTEHDGLGRCGLDWFCEFDAYLKGQDLLKKYAGAWEPGAWFEMVISLKAGVCLADPEHDAIREVHDAILSPSSLKKNHSRPTGLIGRKREVGLRMFDLPQGRSCKSEQLASQRAASSRRCVNCAI
jgi:hypothetical protein